MKQVSRATGRSAVASAAYRCAVRLANERDGLVHDYRGRQGVAQTEIVLPGGVEAAWAMDRSALWNAAEASEIRKDARVAREYEIALPHELSPEQRLALARDFARHVADRYGVAVDVAIHSPHGQTDIRNHHAHLLATTRQVTADGLGAKAECERENRILLAEGLPSTTVQLVELRQAWEQLANTYLARAGLDLRIDARSHAERGLEMAPTRHMGVHATQIERRGEDVVRVRLDAEQAARNAALIREKPDRVLEAITAEKSVFDRRDIARALHRALDGEPQSFSNAMAAVMASPALVTLQDERIDPETGAIEPARFSTREMVVLERGMADAAERLHVMQNHTVAERHVERALARQDAAIRRATGDGAAGLSAEQRHAIGHVTGPERITAVVGFAGAGKSTMLLAAREAWEGQGFAVHGAALSGKAAEGLEESSGIASRTLASWTRGWDNGHGTLGPGDVLVIDEAGMVGSRQLARFVGEVEARGAKLVLVGDHEQLQAIGAGAPFRAVAERIGHAELSDIRRQREGWQRAASVAFATHRTAEGLAAYREHGAIQVEAGNDQARAAMVRDYLADRDSRPEGTRVAVAHRRIDVRALNDGIRSALQEQGALAKGDEAGERVVMTNDGPRSFAPGDRVVFLENDRDLGVKNGMLGTVEAVEAGRLVARLDGVGRDGAARVVDVPTESYGALDHGYATTIHKTQGATVDRSFVLASGTMDRHLTYVAMTRHRDGARLYADAGEFAGREAGRLMAHGAAPYGHDAANRESFFVTLENASGVQRTVWGSDLARAIGEAKPEIGAVIGLERTGSEAVRLPNGTETARQGWRVQDAAEVAQAGLVARLSRSGAKETVLDYEAAEARSFAERRGIAAAFGVASEIAVAVPTIDEQQELRSKPVEARREEPSAAAPATLQPRRRSMFGGREPSQGFGQGGSREDREVLATAARKPAEPGEAVSASPGVLLPAYDEQGRDSLGRSLDKASIMAVMMADRQVKEEQASQAIYLQTAYRDPEAAKVRLDALVQEAGPETVTGRLKAEPGLLGELRGREGLFGGKAAKAERETALRSVTAIGPNVMRQVGAETRAAESYRREVTARMAADRTAIPVLSGRAEVALGRVAAAGTDQERRAATKALMADAGVKTEVDGFCKAVETRFSADELRSVARMVGAGKPIAHASVRPEQQRAFEAVARSYVTLRDGQRDMEHAAQRERQVVRQRQGLGLGL